jgi:hypothetical protein
MHPGIVLPGVCDHEGAEVNGVNLRIDINVVHGFWDDVHQEDARDYDHR